MKTILRADDNFENDEGLCILFCAETRDSRLHAHEFWEIGYVYEGQGKHYTQSGSVPIGEGEFVFLSPYIPEHSIVSPACGEGSLVRVCNCLMREPYMKEVLKKYFSIPELEDYTLRGMLFRNEPVLIQLHDDSGIVYHYLLAIGHEYNHPDLCGKMLRDNALINLLVFITRLYEAKIKGTALPSAKNNLLDNLIRFMKANLSSRLTLNLLAEQVHLSPEYLSRLFKKYTGQNISDYLMELRMKQAKYMLANSASPITDIADYCGYPSIGNFQKAFKKYTSMSPREYRKRHSQI